MNIESQEVKLAYPELSINTQLKEGYLKTILRAHTDGKVFVDIDLNKNDQVERVGSIHSIMDVSSSEKLCEGVLSPEFLQTTYREVLRVVREKLPEERSVMSSLMGDVFIMYNHIHVYQY